MKLDGIKKQFIPADATEEQLKMVEWIDSRSYFGLLERWRFAPIGDPIFAGWMGNYYKNVMDLRRKECPNPVTVCKKVGWGDIEVVEGITMEAGIARDQKEPSPTLKKTLELINETFGRV